MQRKRPLRWFFILALLASVWASNYGAQAGAPQARSAQSGGEVTAYDLILAMNTMRVSYGNSPLIEDPIVNAVAQGTAEIMAANNMSWHIGDVRGRLAAAGYGGGATVWATENFAVAASWGIDEIMQAWADPDHMRPAVNAAYCNVGAGVAKASNGRTYYVLQAAYVAGKSCGEYTSPPGGGGDPGGGGSGFVPGIIVPVKIATPGADGRVYHVVEAGQSFWAIAVAYKITIRDIEVWNNISREMKLQIGQRLFIPGSNTEGYATPTPVGMFEVSLPDQDGKIVHTVQAYQTLTTISQAYKVKIDTILVLNGLQLDWPLSIGQELIIDPGSATPSPTPRPLTPIERLTPESDGKYYHTVSSGETLSWIAQLYEISVADLMAWNRLNSSIIKPEQKLVLQVTPPATETPTPGPATATVPPTLTPPPPTRTGTATRVLYVSTATTEAAPVMESSLSILFLPIGLILGGLFLMIYLARKKQ